MSNKRFEHRPFSQSIKDNLTGYLHSDLKDITDLLNQENDARNKYVDKYWSLVCKLGNKAVEDISYKQMCGEMQKIAIENLEENLEYRKIMDKYGISSVEELDHILFYARVW